MRRYELLITVACFAWMIVGLGFIAWHTVILARMLAEIAALVARTH